MNNLNYKQQGSIKIIILLIIIIVLLAYFQVDLRAWLNNDRVQTVFQVSLDLGKSIWQISLNYFDQLKDYLQTKFTS